MKPIRLILIVLLIAVLVALAVALITTQPAINETNSLSGDFIATQNAED